MTEHVRMTGQGSRAELAPCDFDRVAKVMCELTGIELSPTKKSLVQSRLTGRLKALGLDGFSHYCDMIEKSQNGSERHQMISLLTTNVTSFYRENGHFEHLQSEVIPNLAERLRRKESVRIWSAACSTGEEPYSLAMTFLDAIPDILGLDFKILATDIDPVVLDTAAKGIYPKTVLTGAVSQAQLRHFKRSETSEKDMQVAKAVRDLIAFRQLNLMDTWPMARPFDVILCRNVVIYFGEDTKSKIWRRMSDQLKPSGWLYTGHSERVSQPEEKSLNLVGTTIYQKVDVAHSMERS